MSKTAISSPELAPPVSVALTRAACAGRQRRRCTSQQAAELIEGLRSHNIDNDVS